MKENRIGGILVVLHWASWTDYIGYIGLTPHVGRQCGTIPIYSNRKFSYSVLLNLVVLIKLSPNKICSSKCTSTCLCSFAYALFCGLALVLKQ